MMMNEAALSDLRTDTDQHPSYSTLMRGDTSARALTESFVLNPAAAPAPAARRRAHVRVEQGAWLGILGGGTGARYLISAAHALGYRVALLDPARSSDAARAADRHICANVEDIGSLTRLANACAAVTAAGPEAPQFSLGYLASRCFTTPGVLSVRALSDWNERRALLDPIIESAVMHEIDQEGELTLSVIVARNVLGEIVSYTPAEHVIRQGRIAMAIAPARVFAHIRAQATQAACAIAAALAHRGVLTVEFVLLRDGRLVAARIRPAPSAAGLYTLDACAASQYEQQVRILTGLPLENGRANGAAVSVALTDYAPLWTSTVRRVVNAHRNAHLHLYGKGAKGAGHYTCLGLDVEHALASARAIARELAIAASRADKKRWTRRLEPLPI